MTLSPGRALAVLVGEDGGIENRVVDLPLHLPPGALEEASNYISAHLAGRTLPEAAKAMRAEITSGRSALDSASRDLVERGLAVWSEDAARRPVLIVRGQDGEATESPVTGTGRDWLAQQLEVEGASVQFVIAYERRPPVWTAEQKQQAQQAATDGSVWCLTSSQAIRHLDHLLPTQSWAQARCIATHARIAQTAHALGFGEVQTSRPSMADVLRSLECLA